MAPETDPAILEALSLEAATTIIKSHGGSNFASTFKLTSKTEDENEKLYFVKTGKGADSKLMFTGEHTSLNAINNVVPSLCPRSYAHGALSNTPGGYFLATDFLNLSPRSSAYDKAGTHMSLAQKLAKLHSTPAPIPEGYDTPQFGFPVPTCCGDTVQDNVYRSSWADFYAHNRLLHVLSCGEARHGVDAELRSLVRRTANEVVPRLLRDGHLTSGADGGNIVPVVVHGDLWSGNHGRGSIGSAAEEEVVFDAACCWAHAEYEFGIMRMFGGFGPRFESEYFKLKEKDSPVEEWEDRVELYELYHHLNHYSIFGGSYKGGAVTITKKLLSKYGKDGGDT